MKLQAVAIWTFCAVLFTSACVHAQDKPALDIPIYAGAEPTMEVNLSNEDILPMAKAMLPLMGPKLGGLAEAVTAEEIAEVFKDVKSIQFLQLDVTKPDTTNAAIADFYSRKLPQGSWNRVFWRSDSSKGTVAVYCQPGGQMIYGFRIRSVEEGRKSVRRVEVVKTEGRLDFVKLLSLAAKFAAAAAQSAKQ